MLAVVDTLPTRTLVTRKQQSGPAQSLSGRSHADEDTLDAATVLEGEELTRSPVREGRGSMIGRFMVLRKIGEGGMGVVFSAYDAELDRRVAIKLIQPAREDEQAFARLVREAQGLARVSHPNVVQVHEIGEHRGSMFIAMEYVAGQTLRGWFEANPERSWQQSLELLLQAGRGLAAVHEAKLVHRDFKPDNVIVSNDGRVRVLDFGLVRSEHSIASVEAASKRPVAAVEDPQLSMESLTQTGAMIGTPAYMSIEQLSGGDTGATTDQYAFCLVAFEALYGKRPFAGRSIPDLTRNILAGKIEPRPANSRVPRGVHEAIIRGLSIDPSQRWPNMPALLEVLEQALARRRYGWLWAGGGAIVAVGATLAIAAPRIVALQHDKLAAERERAQYYEQLEHTNDALAQAKAQVERKLDMQVALTAALTADASSPALRLSALDGALRTYASFADESPLPIEVEQAVFAVTRRLHHARDLARDVAGIGDVTTLAFSPDGRTLATGTSDGGLRLSDIASGQTRVLDGHVDDVVFLAFVGDGELLLSASADETASLWRVEDGAALETIYDYRLTSAAYSSASDQIALAASDGTVAVWAGAGESTARRQFDAGAGVTQLGFTHDGQRLFVATSGSLQAWQLEPASAPARQLSNTALDELAPRSIALAGDGSRVAVATHDGALRVWAPGASAVVNIDKVEAGDAERVVFSPGGARLLSVGPEGPPRLWDPSNGELVRELPDHPLPATDVAFSADGRQLATVSYDSTLRVYEPASGRLLELFVGQPGVLTRLAISDDGQQIASAGNDGHTRVWQTQTVSERAFQGSGERLASMAFSPDGAHVAMGERRGRVSVWRTDDGQRTLEFTPTGTPVAMAFSTDGQRLAVGTTSGSAAIWSVDNGSQLVALPEHHTDVVSVAFAPARGQLATGDRMGVMRIWTGEGELVSESPGPEDALTALSFSPDGSLIAGGSYNGSLSMWHASGEQVGERVRAQPTGAPILALAFAPDGRRLASAGIGKTVRIWSLDTGEQLGELVVDDPTVSRLAFSPDGTRIVTGGDTKVQLWQLDGARAIAELGGATQDVLALTYVGADTVYSGGRNGTFVRAVARADARLQLACEALRATRSIVQFESICMQ